MDEDICLMLNDKLLWLYGEISYNNVHDILIFHLRSLKRVISYIYIMMLFVADFCE